MVDTQYTLLISVCKRKHFVSKNVFLWSDIYIYSYILDWL